MSIREWSRQKLKTMKLRKRFWLTIKLLLVLVLVSVPFKSEAEVLTKDEVAFLKSLSGKWRVCYDCDSPFGSMPIDISIKYFNGSIKISYSKTILTHKDGRTGHLMDIINCSYDSKHRVIYFHFKQNFTDLQNDDSINLTEYLTIPFQTDVIDTIVVYWKSVLDGEVISSEEIMLYKH